MKTVCDIECNACYACHDVCPNNAITIEESMSYSKAKIDVTKCTNCNLCAKVCPNINAPELKRPELWYQGWSANKETRRRASSGGIASELIYYCIKNGYYVCACRFVDGEFVFSCTNDLTIASSFAGSKYVKSRPQGAYLAVRKLLVAGEKVLFIGLPCQAAGLQNFIPERLKERLIIVDLICHGTPASSLLKSVLKECAIEVSALTEFKFRDGASFSISTNESISKNIKLDTYLLGFLKGDYYTENCYKCKYACINRVADITLGDSWGTDLTDELKNGVSLILVQTRKGENLIKESEVKLFDVDINRAVASNGQLSHPTEKNAKVDLFYEKMKKTNSFYKSFFRIEKKLYLKQLVKILLYKCKIYKPGMMA